MMPSMLIERAWRRSLWIALLVWLGLCLPPAVGQSNSLFGRRAQPPPQQVPVAQPAGGQPLPPPVDVRAAVRELQPAGLPNVTLLHVSPFAVAAPQLEQIGLHDLVTIIVRISKSATADARMESNKEWQLDSELSKWLRLDEDHNLIPDVFPNGTPGVEFDWEDDYRGDGRFNRSDSLTTRIQAEVIDVKPNGNLVIEAKNHIRHAEEGYILTVTGTCRAEDITPQNTILSSQVADLTVDVTELGAVRDATRRGWFKRGLDFLRPF